MTKAVGEMHPIVREMFAQPVGWLTIVGGLIILGLPLFIALFIRKRMKDDEAKNNSK